MSPTVFRRVLRWIHIAAAIVIGTYLYSPYSENAVFSSITLFLAFPLMAFSGLAMWRQHAVLRLLGRPHK